jgi:hypothetical protein
MIDCGEDMMKVEPVKTNEQFARRLASGPNEPRLQHHNGAGEPELDYWARIEAVRARRLRYVEGRATRKKLRMMAHRANA